jgi:V8-like Glu-specific endopeptidase
LNLVPGRPVEEPQTQKAARSGDVFDQLRDNVVFIWNGNGHGTGFFISPTHILTNAHVVKNIDQVLVVGKGLKVRPGKPPMIAAAVRFRGIDIDAAILEVSDYRHPTYLPFAAEAREGEQISIGGYPAKALKLDRGFTQFKELIAKRQAPTSAQIPTIRFDSGRVQSVFTENSSRLENIQVGVNATGGNSGSPIINACGDVIGLFYAGTRSYVRRTGEVEDPGDFNFAIASKEVAKFLKDAGISVQQNAGKCSS